MTEATSRPATGPVSRLRAVVILCSLIGVVAVPASGTGIVVPAYFYPSWWDSETNLWDDLSAAAGQVPLVAIMNPNSGPGSGVNSDYTHEVDALRAAGGQVIGYVPTTYGNRPIAEVLADVDSYYAWYGIDGIYFDETTDDADTAHLAYYQACYDYVRALDVVALVILGQGTGSTEGYASRSTQMITHEWGNAVLPFLNWTPEPWTANQGADQLSVLSYNVADAAAMRSAVDHAVANNAGWVYFTDDAGSEPVGFAARLLARGSRPSQPGGQRPDQPRRRDDDHTDPDQRKQKQDGQIPSDGNQCLRCRASQSSATGDRVHRHPSVSVRDADGTTSDGRPFFDLTDRIRGAALDPGETTRRLTLYFDNPSSHSPSRRKCTINRPRPVRPSPWRQPVPMRVPHS